MSPEEKNDLDKFFAKLREPECRFLEEYGGVTNEHGAYVYISQSGNSRIALDLFLHSYRMWLIENDIVKEK